MGFVYVYIPNGIYLKLKTDKPIYVIYVYIKKEEGRKEMFYLMMHSTHFIYGYMVSRRKCFIYNYMVSGRKCFI